MSAPVTDSPGERRHPWSHRAVVVCCGGALALVALLAAVWWWTHPSVFSDRYLTLGIDPRPVDDAIAYIGLAKLEDGPRDETVTITGHDVHYSRNEAAARARLLVCVPRDSYGDSALGSGSRSDFASACRSLRPLEDGTQLTLNAQWPPVEYLVLEVEPTRPGSVVVDGLELSYQRSVDHVLQQGTQRIEMTLDLTAT